MTAAPACGSPMAVTASPRSRSTAPRSRESSRRTTAARSSTFVGLVRDHNAGRRVLWLDYEAYEPLALKAFERIGDEAAGRWPAVAARHPSPHRPGGNRRGERGHRRRIAAPGGRVRRVPVRHRADQADRPDLEARALRGRATSGSRARRPIRLDEAARRRGLRARVLVTVRLFARLREIAGAVGAGARRAGRGDRAQRRGISWSVNFPALGDYAQRHLLRGQRGVRAADDAAEGRGRSGVPAAGVGRLKVDGDRFDSRSASDARETMSSDRHVRQTQRRRGAVRAADGRDGRSRRPGRHGEVPHAFEGAVGDAAARRAVPRVQGGRRRSSPRPRS